MTGSVLMENREKKMSDDISFCPKKNCKRLKCFRNQANIKQPWYPHSVFVEIPPDCPYRKYDDNHGIYHTRTVNPEK